jgi:hypothetical protein
MEIVIQVRHKPYLAAVNLVSPIPRPANKNQDVFRKVQRDKIEVSVEAASRDQGGALGMTT